MQRSTASEVEIENSKLDLNLIARVLKDLEEEEKRDPEEINTTPKPAVDGDKLIQEALKVNILNYCSLHASQMTYRDKSKLTGIYNFFYNLKNYFGSVFHLRAMLTPIRKLWT